MIRSLKAQGKCRFRTLLLSATYSKSTRNILIDQFHDENSELIEVSANFLRPEPEYFVHHEANENTHRQRVEQLLMTVPRPLILYCTTRTDAEMWSVRLHELGYWRTGIFHGQIDTNNRKILISKWKNDQLDIMVATSAFGVGMNKRIFAASYMLPFRKVSTVITRTAGAPGVTVDPAKCTLYGIRRK